MSFDKKNVKLINKKIELQEMKCSLKIRMRIVISRDFKRKDKKKEWNELLEKNLIDSKDHSAT